MKEKYEEAKMTIFYLVPDMITTSSGGKLELGSGAAGDSDDTNQDTFGSIIGN